MGLFKNLKAQVQAATEIAAEMRAAPSTQRRRRKSTACWIPAATPEA